MSLLLVLSLAAFEPANPNEEEFKQWGYERAAVTAADKKAENLPDVAAAWNGSPWWRALIWCSTMHGVHKLRLEKEGAAKPALDEQEALSKSFQDLAVARLVADRGVTPKQAWDNFLEAEDADWTVGYMHQPLDYRVESMTCRLFKTRVARL